MKSKSNLCSGFALIGSSNPKGYYGTRILGIYALASGPGPAGDASTDCLYDPGLKNGLLSIYRSITESEIASCRFSISILMSLICS